MTDLSIKRDDIILSDSTSVTYDAIGSKNRTSYYHPKGLYLEAFSGNKNQLLPRYICDVD